MTQDIVGIPARSTVSHVALIVCLAGLACEEPATRGAVARDSAGVAIIENGPVSGQLGSLVGQGNAIVDTLPWSRISSVRLLSDSGLVVTDDAAQRLVQYNSRGQRTGVAGRAGDGPGEFRGFRGMWVCAEDTVLVRSGSLRIDVFAEDLRFIDAITLPEAPGLVSGVSADCARVVLLKPLTQGLLDSAQVSWYDYRTSASSPVASVLVNTRQEIEYLGERSAVPVPFSVGATYAVADEYLYIAGDGIPELRAYDRDGTLRRVVRWQDRSRVSADDLAVYKRKRLMVDQVVGEGASSRVAELESFRLPTERPAYARVLYDDRGFLWVRKYPIGGYVFERAYGSALMLEDAEWLIFAEDGTLIGEGTTPAGLLVRDLRGGQLVGVREDSLGIPSIHVYPLKPVNSAVH